MNISKFSLIHRPSVCKMFLICYIESVVYGSFGFGVYYNKGYQSVDRWKIFVLRYLDTVFYLVFGSNLIQKGLFVC